MNKRDPRADKQRQIFKGATVGVALRGHPFHEEMLRVLTDGRPQRAADYS